MENIIKLLNKNNIVKVKKLITKDNSLLNLWYNQKRILDIAIDRNYQDLVKFIINIDHKLLVSRDILDKLPIHNIYKNKYIGLFNNLFNKYPQYCSHLNGNHFNLMFVACLHNDLPLIKKILNIDKSTIDVVTKDGWTCLHALITNINNNQSPVENTTKTIKYLLKNNFNPNLANSYPCTNFIIAHIKDESIAVNIIKLLINYNLDLNIRPSPLSYAINLKKQKIAEYLIKVGCLIMSDHFYYTIKILNNHLLKILFDNVKNQNQLLYLDDDLNTLLHLAISYKIDYENIFKFIGYGNINAKNINLITPLHTLIQNHNIEHFEIILSNRFVNIFSKDNLGNRPIDYISNDKLLHLLDIFVKGYKKHYAIYSKNIYCLKDISKKIFNSEKCLPSIKSNITFEPEVNHVTFSTNTSSIIIYYYYLVKKLNNLISIPFISHLPDIISNNNILFDNCTFYNTDNGILYRNLFYTTKFASNYGTFSIFWDNKEAHYVSKDFKFYLLKAMYNKTKYIAVNLLISYKTIGHANILLYNKDTCVLERFDPAGIQADSQTDKDLDIFLKKLFKEIVAIYNKSNNINKKFTYYSPVNFFIQGASKDNNYNYLKDGDPVGYCVAWCVWFLENRVIYPDLSYAEFLKVAIDLIIEKKYIDKSNNLLTFIRNYAHKLSSIKSDIYALAGIDKMFHFDGVTKKNAQKLLWGIVNNLY
jgi:hypothetical protein